MCVCLTDVLLIFLIYFIKRGLRLCIFYFDLQYMYIEILKYFESCGKFHRVNWQGGVGGGQKHIIDF